MHLDTQEVLYIVNSAKSVAEYFVKLGIPWLSIQASHIFISTSGCVYFSPVKILKSSVTPDICGGCVITPLKYEKISQQTPKNAKHDLKKLVLDLTQNCSKHGITKYQDIFVAVEIADSIGKIQLPESKCSAINMLKLRKRMDLESSVGES